MYINQRLNMLRTFGAIGVSEESYGALMNAPDKKTLLAGVSEEALQGYTDIKTGVPLRVFFTNISIALQRALVSQLNNKGYTAAYYDDNELKNSYEEKTGASFTRDLAMFRNSHLN